MDRAGVRHVCHLLLVACVPCVLQGTRDLNPQPSVLETDALPVELVPSGGAAPRPHTRGTGSTKQVVRTTKPEAYARPPSGVEPAAYASSPPGSRRGCRPWAIGTCARSPRPISTCTSPGPCGTRPLLELAERDGIALPDSLVEDWPPRLSAADEKGWFRFQRLYDVARSVLRTPDDVRRLVLEAAEDDVADGGRWLEIQVDPSGYAARFGGITAFTDLVLDCVRDASERTGLRHGRGDRRQPHPAPARRPHPRPARRAVRRPRRGRLRALQRRAARAAPATSRAAFAIAERAGLLLAPHGGELRGPEHIRVCLDELHADRLGHGVRAAEDPALLDRIVEAGVALEVCPVSNVALGVYSDLTSVPLPQLIAAGRDHRARGRRSAALRLAARRPVRHDARRPRARRRRPSPGWPAAPSWRPGHRPS